MAAPTTDINICNLALDRLGQPPVSSIVNPTTAIEQVVARAYDQARRTLLRAYIFNFAKKYATLAVDGTEVPAFGFSSAFALPNDFVRLMALGDVTVNNDVPADFYDMSNGFIYTDEGDDGVLDIQYIFDARTVTKYDPLFVDLLKLKLAMDTAYKFTLKPGLSKQIGEEFEAVALRAAAIAGQEKPPRRVERSKWRAARRTGYIAPRDNRFVS
jgi:hypothetical protein